MTKKSSSRNVAGKEVLGCEEMFAGVGDAPWISMEAVGRALTNHLQRTAAAECWPQAATVQLSFAAPHFTVEAEPPRTPPRQPKAEDYASPYTRGCGICHHGAIVVDI